MIAVLWNLVSFVVALGILVTVHEFGHFWVARKCGVRVQRFSVGFGKVLWRKFDAQGTEFVVSAIPLGGYVKMLDERVDEVDEQDKPFAFNRKNVYQRIAVIAAGPGANFVFAIFALWLMYLIGVPSIKPVITDVNEGSVAAQMQLDGNQQVIKVGGRNVSDWQQVSYELITHIGEKNLTLTTSQVGGNSENQHRLDISNWKFDAEKESPVTSLGLVPLRPKAKLSLARVTEGSAAAKGGLKVGDTITQANDLPMKNWKAFESLIKANPNNEMKLQVLRGGEPLRLLVTPQSHELPDGSSIGFLGVSPEVESWPEEVLFEQSYGPIDAIGKGIERTWRLIGLSLNMIGKLVTGDVSVKALSGPISIAQGAGTTAGYGFVYFLGFLALISVNLGVINLLPLPVLDGGHLAYYFVEMITGKPVPEKIQEVGFRIGAMLLLVLMSVAIFNDISRL